MKPLRALRPRRKVPLIRQTESMECGLACIAMVLAYHGASIPLRRLRERYGFSLRGASLAALIRVATDLGLRPLALRTEPAALADLEHPCILHWNDRHYVVLVRVSSGRYMVNDPALGTLTLSAEEVARSFTGAVLLLEPTDGLNEVERHARKLRLRDFVVGVRGFWPALLMIAGITALSQLTVVGLPLFSKALVDTVVQGGVWDLLPYILAAWIAALGLQVGLDAIRSLYAAHAQNRYAVKAREALFEHLMSLPLQYFQRRHFVDVHQRFRAMDDILNVLTEGTTSTVLDSAFCVLGLCLVFLYSGPLALLTFVALLLIAAVVVRSVPRQNQQLAQIISSANAESGLVFESIRGAQTLKLLSAEPRRLRQYRSAAEAATADRLRYATFSTKISAVTAAIQGTAQISCLGVGALLVNSGSLSLGALFAFQSYQHVLLSRFQSGVLSFARIRNAAVNLERMEDIVFERPEVEAEEPRVVSLGRRASRIALDGVAYRYSSHDPLVLSDIELTVEPGECVAIVGASGCGKTTLIKIIAGLLTPTEGTVRIGSETLGPHNLREHRTSIGAVMQGDELFSGTLLENICYPDEQVDDKRLGEALEEAGIADTLADFPMGLNTLVGDMGSALSAGQKQRVLIARALYRRPSLLLLDEATANLDAERESRIVDVIGEFDATRIIVTHRPEILRIADRVGVLDDGRLTFSADRTAAAVT